MKNWVVFLLVSIFLFGICVTMVEGREATVKDKLKPQQYTGTGISVPGMDSNSPTNDQIAGAIFTKINEVRAKYNKYALKRNSQLDGVAQGFSDSMATTLTYPYNPPHNAGGNNWSGANGRMKQILKMGFAYPAENIMLVNPSTTEFGCDHIKTTVGDTADGIAAFTVLSWVEHDSCAQDGHKKTLLGDPANYGGSNDYLPTDVGIGVAKGSDGNYYITSDFAHK